MSPSNNRTTPVLTADVLVKEYRQQATTSKSAKQRPDLLTESLVDQLRDENANATFANSFADVNNASDSDDDDESDSDDDFDLVIEKKIDVVTERNSEPMSDEDEDEYDDDDDDEEDEDRNGDGDDDNKEDESENKESSENVVDAIGDQNEKKEDTEKADNETTDDHAAEEYEGAERQVEGDEVEDILMSDDENEQAESTESVTTHMENNNDDIEPTLDGSLPSLSVAPQQPVVASPTRHKIELKSSMLLLEEPVDSGIEFESDEEDEDEKRERLLNLKEKRLMQKEKKVKLSMLKSSEWNNVPDGDDDEDESEFVDRECIEDDEDEEGRAAMADDDDDEAEHIGEDEMEEIGDFIVLSNKIGDIDEMRARRLRRKAEMTEELVQSDDEEDELEQEQEYLDGEELEKWNHDLLNPVTKTFVPGSVDHAELLKQLTNESTGTFSRFSKRSAELIRATIQSVQLSNPELLSPSLSDERERQMREEYLQEKRRLEDERRKNTKRLLDNFRMLRKRQKKLRRLSAEAQASTEQSVMPPDYDDDEEEADEPLHHYSSDSDGAYDDADVEQTGPKTITFAGKTNSTPTTTTTTTPEENGDENNVQHEEEAAVQASSEPPTPPQSVLAAEPVNLFSHMPASAIANPNKRRRSEEFPAATGDTSTTTMANKKRKVTSMTMHGQKISARSSFLNSDVSSKAKRFAKQYKKNLKNDKQYEGTMNPKPIGQYSSTGSAASKSNTNNKSKDQ